MAQGKFTTSPTFQTLLNMINGLVDDIAGKAASSHNHSADNITSGTLPIARGGTGATDATNALTNLGIIGAITGLSVSGKTITYTKKDGTTGTITTQDTVYTHPTSAGNKHIPSGGSSGQILRWSAAGTAVWGSDNSTCIIAQSLGTNGYVKFANGLILQWGVFNSGTNWDTYFTFPIAFSVACYAVTVSDIYSGDKNEDVYIRETPSTTKFRVRVGADFNTKHMIIAVGK